jgi:protein-S-isoprenylcysteine O-methyltransferase Ste14
MKMRKLVPTIIGLLLYLLPAPALLLLAAGTLNWLQAWVYGMLALSSSIASRFIVLKRNPDTLLERSRFASAEGIQAWDRLLMLIGALIGPIAVLIVAGLDYRHQLSPVVPLAVQVLACLLIAFGYAVVAWAMVANPYFLAVARIQDDRGQVVVDAGPY